MCLQKSSFLWTQCTIAIIIFLSLSGCMMMEKNKYAYNNKRSFELIPINVDSLLRYNLDVQPYLEKYKGSSAVYIYHFTRLDQVPTENYLIKTVQYIVLNKKHKEVTVLEIPAEESEEIITFYCVLKHPNGTHKVFGVNDLIRAKEDEDYEYKLAFQDVQNGTIVEYGYEMKSNYGISKSSFLFLPTQFYYPCERLKILAAIPLSMHPTAKPLINDDNITFKAEIDRIKDKHMFYFLRKNIPALKSEPMSGYLYEEAPPFVITDQEEVNYGGTIRRFWSVMPDFHGISDDIRELSADITKHCKSKTEKLDTILKYIRTEFVIHNNEKYYKFKAPFSSGTYDFDQIVTEKKAPERFLVSLMRALLYCSDIPSDFCLVNSKKWGNLSGVNASVATMESGIITVIDNKTYAVFPFVDKRLPYSCIPLDLLGQKAIAIHTDYGKYNDYFEYDITTIPKISPQMTEINEYLDVIVHNNGKISVKDKRQLVGRCAALVAEKYSQLKEEQKLIEYKEDINYKNSKVSIKKVDFTGLNDKTSGYLTIESDYTMENTISVLPDEAIIQTNGMFGLHSYFMLKDDTAKRENKVYIREPIRSTRKVTLHLPTQWKIQQLKKNELLTNTLGEVEWQATEDANTNTITIEIRRELHSGVFQPEDYGDLLNVIGTQARYTNENLMFTIR